MSERRVFHASTEGHVHAESVAASVTAPAGAEDALVFTTHVLSLNAATLLQLGLMDAPDGEAVERDLDAAKHLIDTLAVLERKTRGNLTDEEAKLLTTVLYELRLRYVEARG
jgi:hypothetical protein